MRTRPRRVVVSTSVETRPDGTFRLLNAGNGDEGFLPDFDMRDFSFNDLSIEFDVAILNDTEHRLARACTHGADTCITAADDTVGGSFNLGIAELPIEFPALGFDL